MNNVLAAKVLKSHLSEVSDGAYKTALEIAIETLYQDALKDWYNLDTKLEAYEYLELTKEEYQKWLHGGN